MSDPLRTYRDWIVGGALPVWAEAGWDAAHERFRERLDTAGRPLDVAHRSMVQARQIYVYAHAAQLGWFPDGGRLAEAAMASLRRDFLAESADTASVAFSIHSDGRVASDVRDAYAHAFVLFAIAWLHRLNGDAALPPLADKVAKFIDRTLVDPAHGGLFDAVPGDTGFKRQNPLMHLLEAYLALERSMPGRGWMERAGGLVKLFREHLVRDGVLLEYFARDWSAHPDPAKGRMFEPGHHFEWVWLLREYELLSGENMSPWSEPLYAIARDHGLSEAGLIYDEVRLDMMPAKRSHRIWPHTEAIKVAAAWHLAADGDARSFAEAMAEALLVRFLDRPFRGGWTDQVDADGRPLVDHAPASSLYHLFFAAAEAAAAFDPAPSR